MLVAIIFLALACIANTISIVILSRRIHLKFPDGCLTKSDVLRANRLQEYFKTINSQ